MLRRCEAPCKSACPPCKRSCDYRCFHRKCPRSCGDECVVCNEPCLWQCPHARCEHGCNAYCDRKPCDEPCPKILRCGHSCIGLCGEVCPPMCPACSHVKIPDFDKSKRCNQSTLHPLKSSCLSFFSFLLGTSIYRNASTGSNWREWMNGWG